LPLCVLRVIQLRHLILILGKLVNITVHVISVTLGNDT